MFIFNSEHLLINRMITRGSAKQTNSPYSFDIDRDYNIIMSDLSNHCVYDFNKEGEQIHKFGKQGQGRILLSMGNNVNGCLQFF